MRKKAKANKVGSRCTTGNRWNRTKITQCAVKREALAPDVEEVARTPPPPRAPPVPPPPPPPLLTSEELASHWRNQAALFNKANGYVKGALTKISLQAYVQEFDHLSELSPYGTTCLMAMSRRFHQQYLYKYQFTGPVRCGVFTTASYTQLLEWELHATFRRRVTRKCWNASYTPRFDGESHAIF